MQSVIKCIIYSVAIAVEGVRSYFISTKDTPDIAIAWELYVVSCEYSLEIEDVIRDCTINTLVLQDFVSQFEWSHPVHRGNAESLINIETWKKLKEYILFSPRCPRW